MDDAILQFLSKGTFVLAVLVIIINFFIRRTVEIIRPDFKPLGGTMDKKAMYADRAAMWWNEIGLYALPVLIGANLGLVKGLGFLFDPSIKTVSGHVFYAAVVGWFADFIYDVIKQILYKSTGVSLPSAEDLSTASTQVVVVHEEHHHDHDDCQAQQATQASTITTTTVTVNSPPPPEVVVVPDPMPAPPAAPPVVVVTPPPAPPAVTDAPPGPAPTALGSEEPPKSG
jgi:hypothetical protein